MQPIGFEQTVREDRAIGKTTIGNAPFSPASTIRARPSLESARQNARAAPTLRMGKPPR